MNSLVKITAKQLVCNAINGEDMRLVGKVIAKSFYATGMTIEQANAAAQALQDEAIAYLKTLSKNEIAELVMS